MTANNNLDSRLSLFVSVRRSIRQIPIFGPIAYALWLRLMRGEGRIIEVSGGALAGIKVFRRMGFTTVLPGLEDGTYEEEVFTRLSEFLRPGQLIFDLGSHAGLFAIYAAKRVGVEGRVIAVEAHPRNASLLRRNINLNCVKNCQVVSVAIGGSIGESVLLDSRNSSMFRLSRDAEHPQFGTRVKTTTLSNLAQQYGNPDVIKMDIEGAESVALQAATDFLRTNRPVLLVEVHGADVAECLYPFLREIGYRLTDLNGDELAMEHWDRFMIAQ